MKFSPANWRIVHSPPASGPWNMAVDEAILEAVGNRESPPTLRLYAWEPPCLSLGYAQPVTDVDHDSLSRRGWGLVRRPTGGRAILHTDELTYSVIAPNNEPRVIGGVLESYRRLARALLEALHLMQVPAHAEEEYPSGSNPRGPVCFETPSNWEITVNGKKLIGSAQVRGRAGVLQHGTLPLCGDLTRITQALAFPDEAGRALAAGRLLAQATTVEATLRRQVTWEEAASAVQKGFEKVLSLKLTPGGPTPIEKARAAELVETKYGAAKWTNRIKSFTHSQKQLPGSPNHGAARKNTLQHSFGQHPESRPPAMIPR